MPKKDKSKGQGDILTVTEINQLNWMHPGDTAVVHNMLVRCHKSHPCQSGANCQHCALYDRVCEGVACMKGIRYTDCEGRVRIRKTDVFYAILF